MEKPLLYRSFNRRRLQGQIYHGDALAYLTGRRSGSSDLIFLDPPFNLGKQYTADDPALDCRPEDAYEGWMVRVLEECVRILSPGGALYLYHIPIWAMRFGAHLHESLHFRHWISVVMKNGFMRGNRLYPAHYALLYFTKGEPLVFHRPKLQPYTCRHCGGYIRDYGGYRKIIEERGINLSDVWDDLSPVRHKNTKQRAANELPMKLTERVMAMSGGPGLRYLDPFAGGGSGVVAAARRGMRFRSCDIVRSNCELIESRLNDLSAELRAVG